MAHACFDLMPEVDLTNEKTYHQCVIRSDIRQLRIPQRVVIQEAARHHFTAQAIFAIRLALEETLANAVKHGNRQDPNKRVIVRYAIDAERAVIIVRDEGGGFIPEEVPDCTCTERLAVPNGRGIMLMRAYMDEVCYRDHGREVYFSKRNA